MEQRESIQTGLRIVLAYITPHRNRPHQHMQALGLAILFACLGHDTMAAAATGAEPAGTPPPAAKTEIQFSLCAPPEQIETSLTLHPHGTPLDVWLFDDPALSLFTQGLRFRMRIAQGTSELTLKVANQDCAHLAPGLVPPAEGKCEYDMHGAIIAGAVSLTRNIDANTARDLLDGKLLLAGILSESQTRYLREKTGAWPLPAGIRALGPQRVTRYRAKGKPYDVNVSRLPGGDVYVEISRKVLTADATRAKQELADELARAGVAMCPDQSGQAINKLRSLQH